MWLGDFARLCCRCPPACPPGSGFCCLGAAGGAAAGGQGAVLKLLQQLTGRHRAGCKLLWLRERWLRWLCAIRAAPLQYKYHHLIEPERSAARREQR